MAELGRTVIEYVEFTGVGVLIKGWAWHPDSTLTLYLYFRTNGSWIPIENMNGPSDELTKVLGSSAANCRFAIEHPIPKWDVRAVKSAVIITQLNDGSHRTTNVLSHGEYGRSGIWSGGREPRLGIGITTYNRSSLLMSVLEGVRENTKHEHELIVCDDGSTDDTPAKLAGSNVAYLSAPNMGIAWNKNRALYYLRVVRECDVIILLEDDTRPSVPGWEKAWISACLAYGHVNFAGQWCLDRLAGGWGHWYQPYLSERFSGQCTGFSAEALDFAGYFDTRFKTYGFEHIEHTVRMVRNGYGGLLGLPTKHSLHYFLINGNVEVLPSKSHGTPELIAANGIYYEAALRDTSCRPPWRDDAQREQLLREMILIKTGGPISLTSQ